ncbi:Rap-GAP domain-containing protein [Entamoeba marina]
MSAARGQFSRLLLSDERFFNILLHMYTEMYTVFTPSNKDCISQFLTLYKDFFFNQQSNLQSVLKDKLTTTQFKIIETPSSWFSQQFLTTQLANTETKSLLELIISFYDKFSQLENELTPSLKSTVLSTITQCSLNFLQYAKDPSYIPYKKELLNTLFILHIEWMQYEGDWLELLSRLQPMFDVDVLTVIQNKIEHLTVVFVQKVYHETLFSTKHPIETSPYITTNTKESYYDDPNSEPKLAAIKTNWDARRVRDLWLLIFKFLDHPLQLTSVECITKNIEILLSITNLLTFAEETSTLQINLDGSTPHSMPRQSAWNVQPSWKPGRKTIQTAQAHSDESSTTFSFSNSSFLPLQELLIPIFAEVIIRPQSFVTEQSRCNCFNALGHIITRIFPYYEQPVYNAYTSLVQNIHQQSVKVQWEFITSSYMLFLNPHNSTLACLPGVLQCLSNLGAGSASTDDQIKCCYLIQSLVYIEHQHPKLKEFFNQCGNPLPSEYTSLLLQIITGAMRIMPSFETQSLLLWCLGHFIDFRPYFDKIFEAIRSPSFLIYSTALEVLSFLSSIASTIPENIVNYIIDALCNIALTCPITVNCFSLIFDVLSRWLLSYGKNLFSVELLNETTDSLFKVIQLALDQEEPPSTTDTPTTCAPPHTAAQKFVALLSQVVFGDPIEHALFKCPPVDVPDQNDARFFSYGESTILSVLPSDNTHTRIFIRNPFGMYEWEISPLQTIKDLEIEDIVDDFKPITQIPWAKNNKKTGIPKPDIYTTENALSKLMEEYNKQDSTLLMAEFPEEAYDVKEYMQFITKVENVLNTTEKQENEFAEKALDAVDVNPLQLDLNETSCDVLCEYLQNILHIFSMNEKLLVPIESTSEFFKQLVAFDNLKPRLFFKTTIIYVAEEDLDLNKITAHTSGSKEYNDFVRSLGWFVPTNEIECDPQLLQHTTDDSICYSADSLYEFVFEEICKMRSMSEKVYSQTSSLVHFVWDEGIKPYHPHVLGSYAEVVIVIRPCSNGLFAINLFKKTDFPIVGPITHNCLVPGNILAKALKETVVNIHFNYLGNGYSKMDGCAHRQEQLWKLVSYSHLPKDYTLCKELQLILNKKH